LARKLAELRIVIREKDAFALAGYMTMTASGDIYCGSGHRKDWIPKMKLGDQSLRTSYHRDGNVFVRTIDEIMKGPSLEPPSAATGFRILATAGLPIVDQHFAADAPKPNSRYRTTRIIERRPLPHSTITIDWFVLGEESLAEMPELLKEEYSDRSVLGYAISYWTTPVIGMIAWTSRVVERCRQSNARGEAEEKSRASITERLAACARISRTQLIKMRCAR